MQEITAKYKRGERILVDFSKSGIFIGTIKQTKGKNLFVELDDGSSITIKDNSKYILGRGIEDFRTKPIPVDELDNWLITETPVTRKKATLPEKLEKVQVYEGIRVSPQKTGVPTPDAVEKWYTIWENEPPKDVYYKYLLHKKGKSKPYFIWVLGQFGSSSFKPDSILNVFTFDSDGQITKFKYPHTLETMIFNGELVIPTRINPEKVGRKDLKRGGKLHITFTNGLPASKRATVEKKIEVTYKKALAKIADPRLKAMVLKYVENYGITIVKKGDYLGLYRPSEDAPNIRINSNYVMNPTLFAEGLIHECIHYRLFKDGQKGNKIVKRFAKDYLFQFIDLPMSDRLVARWWKVYLNGKTKANTDAVRSLFGSFGIIISDKEAYGFTTYIETATSLIGLLGSGGTFASSEIKEFGELLYDNIKMFLK